MAKDNERNEQDMSAEELTKLYNDTLKTGGEIKVEGTIKDGVQKSTLQLGSMKVTGAILICVTDNKAAQFMFGDTQSIASAVASSMNQDEGLVSQVFKLVTVLRTIDPDMDLTNIDPNDLPNEMVDKVVEKLNEMGVDARAIGVDPDADPSSTPTVSFTNKGPKGTIH